MFFERLVLGVGWSDCGGGYGALERGDEGVSVLFSIHHGVECRSKQLILITCTHKFLLRGG